VWSVAYLVTLGSVGLFVLILLVVRRWTASATSYVFVLFPVVTMLLGALLADEPLTARGVIGALVVMSGVWFGALAPSARQVAAPPRESPAAAAEMA
jgi:drug/metabolite transporter (DMT)-like permease